MQRQPSNAVVLHRYADGTVRKAGGELVRGPDVPDGRVPHLGHVSADERGVHDAEPVLFGPVHQRALRRAGVWRGGRSVWPRAELLLVSVRHQSLPIGGRGFAHG
jgi:hypothetical protein